MALNPDASIPTADGFVKSICRSTGIPTPLVYWVDDDDGNNSTAKLTTNTSGSDAIMTLKGATARDSGRLRCVAENEAGMAATYFHIYCKLLAIH